MAWMRDMSVTDAEICSACAVQNKSFWSLSGARQALMRDKDWQTRIVRYLYRPFDACWLYAAPEFVHRLRRQVMQHMERANIALAVGRAGLVIEGEWNLTFVTDTMCDHNLFYRGSSINFPLFRYNSEAELGLKRTDNIDTTYKAELARALDPDRGKGETSPGLEPEHVMHYAYAILHSPCYRRRYSEFLKVDFPRLPLPGSRGLFENLAALGGELASLHLMESPGLEQFITTYRGPDNPEITRVNWLKNAVWLDAASTRKGQPSLPGSIGFHGVPENVWNFHIGGYQVCEKWLKDRKGRTLSDEDVIHYQKIVVALSETIRIMGEIDEVIEKYGGWPGAFRSTKT